MSYSVPIIFPPLFNELHAIAFFTTRSPESGITAVSKTFPKQFRRIYLPIQKHTGRVVVIGQDPEPEIADAVVTGRKGILIGIMVADCLPILVFDAKKEVIGAVHAGWRGTAAGILKATIGTMTEEFASSPSDLLVAAGPCIKGCCYEVGPEVTAAVSEVTGGGDYIWEKGGKYYLDLSAANRCQAESSGVPPGNIWASDECTFCNPDRFYSYRHSKGTAGRQYGFIGMI